MTKGLAFILISAVVAGCATADSVNRKYEAVAIEDGISKSEAVTIAQTKLAEQNRQDEFRMSQPEIWDSPSALKYPEYWFVGFSQRHVQMTNDFIYYFVVVDKKTGKIKGAEVLNLSRGGALDSLVDH